MGALITIFASVWSPRETVGLLGAWREHLLGKKSGSLNGVPGEPAVPAAQTRRVQLPFICQSPGR